MNNLWLIPGSNKEAFKNLPKTMANPISKDRLMKAGINETDREYYAWGTRPGTNDKSVEKWNKMRPNDVCLFYTQDLDGREKAYHWLAKIVKTKRNRVLSKAFWDDPIFELVYFIEKPVKIFITVQDLSAEFQKYRNNYMKQPPMGFMKVDTEVVHNIMADHGSIISWVNKIFKLKSGGKNMDNLLAHFQADLLKAKLHYSHNLLGRFVASCLSKRFVILTGLSGSGKTKLAQSFSYWIVENNKRKYTINRFSTGEIIESSRVKYEITEADSISITLTQVDTKTKATLPYELIDEWIDVIKSNNFSDTTTPRTIRDEVARTTKYSDISPEKWTRG